MFSFVLPVFNAENTILKTINSILDNSTKEDLEIIIVNEGSTDNTGELIKNFENDFRFKIFNQKNAGVSVARNRALKELSADSSFVAFIDDSDRISENYIDTHVEILNEHPEINLSIAPITLEKNNKQSPQSLNFRFNIKEDIVDVDKYPDFVQYHLGGTVFRTKVFKENKLEFMKDIQFWEDALLINTVILKNKKYALAKKADYYYDRNDENSLSHKAWGREYRYTIHIKNSYFPLIKMSEKKYGKVIPYIQHLIAKHYLQYLLEHNQRSIIKYKNFVDIEFDIWSKKLFSYIDIETIEQLECPMSCKMYLYNLKDIDKVLNDYRKNIKLLIQKINLKEKRLIFTFSEEATGISNCSHIYFDKISGEQARILETKSQYFVGREVDGDITRNKYQIPLNYKMFINDFTVIIKDELNRYEVKSASILKRLLRKVSSK